MMKALPTANNVEKVIKLQIDLQRLNFLCVHRKSLQSYGTATQHPFHLLVRKRGCEDPALFVLNERDLYWMITGFRTAHIKGRISFSMFWFRYATCIRHLFSPCIKCIDIFAFLYTNNIKKTLTICIENISVRNDHWFDTKKTRPAHTTNLISP